MNSKEVNDVVIHMVELTRLQRANLYERQRTTDEIDDLKAEIKRLEKEADKLDYQHNEASIKLNRLLDLGIAIDFRAYVDGDLYLFSRTGYQKWKTTHIPELTLGQLLDELTNEVGQ